ncbi:nucleotidyltransferase domain-containing protein [Actinomadura sp. HBU206391]|uniref:nucleotidyltransferase domain-containing protein n=1 Tax=Actinomadura sp. HBU206391 TaxID=2731692 RepID=UPI001C9CD515
MDQIQEIVGLVGDVLGPEAIGAYLHGSSLLGGLKPASDLDVLVVSQRRMDGQERGRSLKDCSRSPVPRPGPARSNSPL